MEKLSFIYLLFVGLIFIFNSKSYLLINYLFLDNCINYLETTAFIQVFIMQWNVWILMACTVQRILKARIPSNLPSDQETEHFWHLTEFSDVLFPVSPHVCLPRSHHHCSGSITVRFVLSILELRINGIISSLLCLAFSFGGHFWDSFTASQVSIVQSYLLLSIVPWYE